MKITFDSQQKENLIYLCILIVVAVLFFGVSYFYQSKDTIQKIDKEKEQRIENKNSIEYI